MMALWRRIMLWGIPGVLLAALAWSLVPHAGPPATPPVPAGSRAAQPTAARADGAPSDANGEMVPVEGAAKRATAMRPETPAATLLEKTVASGEIHGGTLVGTDEAGRPRWQIKADDVLLGQGQKVVLLRNVHATFYDPQGTPMTVTGARGQYNTTTREVDLEGSVHGVSSTGREIFADTLHYSPAAANVTGAGHVRVVEERVIMYADQMVSDITLGQTKFFGNVHMTLK